LFVFKKKQLMLRCAQHDRCCQARTGPCWIIYSRTPSRALTRQLAGCAIRYSNPIPSFNDLREELANWRDEEGLERTIDEAKLAAIKLRLWTGKAGPVGEFAFPAPRPR